MTPFAIELFSGKMNLKEVAKNTTVSIRHILSRDNVRSLRKLFFLPSSLLALHSAVSIEWEDCSGACSFLLIHAANIYGIIFCESDTKLTANSTFPILFINPNMFLGVVCKTAF
jgi:hypothetical protein